MAIEPTASRPTHDELVAGLAEMREAALEAANVAADAIGQNEQTARAPERD